MLASILIVSNILTGVFAWGLTYNHFQNKEKAEVKAVEKEAIVTAPEEIEKESEEEESEERIAFIVSEVVDGDTIKITYDQKEETLRLIGIDTPESQHPNKKVECFAIESSEKLSELIFGKEVYVEFDKTQDKRDKYARALMYVWRAEDNLFINQYMVEQGFAHEYTYQTPYKFQSDFKAAEIKAKTNEFGLWGPSCACEKGKEVERKCNGCKKAEVSYTNWDCSQYQIESDDEDCTELCPKPTVVETLPPSPSYTCNCSKTCSQLTCAEAYYQLNTCGCSQRDGDNDGIPCESKCN